MRASALLSLLLLGGCTTLAVAAPPAPDPEVRVAVARSAAELRALLDTLAAPAAVPDYAAARGALATARARVLGSSLRAGAADGVAAQAERAALGVTLRLCADGVDRLESLPRADAQRYARAGFAIACLAPLALF
jgi:hypothetical protein